MSQIDTNKHYRTRSGKEVQIYTIHEGQDFPVHGAYYCNGRWIVDTWKTDGRSGYIDTDRDLVEVKPRVKGEYWLNIYPCYCGGQVYVSKEDADMFAQMGRIACIHREYDVEDGEGL